MKPLVERLRRPVSLIAGLIFLVVVIFSRTPHEATTAYELLGVASFVLVCVAVIGRLWCTVYIGGRKNQQLVTDGPYSLWRNPLYVFSFIGLIGIVLGTRTLLLSAVAIPAFLIYYRFVIRAEEARLETIFGESFRAYKAKVGVVFPNLGNYWSRADFEVTPLYFRKAMADAAMFVCAMAAVEIVHRLKVVDAIPGLFKLPF